MLQDSLISTCGNYEYDYQAPAGKLPNDIHELNCLGSNLQISLFSDSPLQQQTTPTVVYH